jgi:hypothetical protein
MRNTNKREKIIVVGSLSGQDTDETADETDHINRGGIPGKRAPSGVNEGVRPLHNFCPVEGCNSTSQHAPAHKPERVGVVALLSATLWTSSSLVQAVPLARSLESWWSQK